MKSLTVVLSFGWISKLPRFSYRDNYKFIMKGFKWHELRIDTMYQIYSLHCNITIGNIISRLLILVISSDQIT